MLALHAGHSDSQSFHLLPVDEHGDGLHPQHADGGDDGQDESQPGEGLLPYGDNHHQEEGASQTCSQKENGEHVEDIFHVLSWLQILVNAHTD